LQRSSFVSDFFPEHLVKRFFPGQQAAPPGKLARFHLRNIYVVPTRTGFGLLCIILLTLVAAINFQNSLIYIISFWLASLLLINVLYSYRNLSGLKIELLGPGVCFAGQSCPVSLRASGEGGRESIYVGWKGVDLALLNLYASNSIELKIAYPAPRRGRLQPPRLDVLTRYPAGLVVSWAYARLDIQAIVFPQPRLMGEDGLPGVADEGAEQGREIAFGVNDFSGLNHYQQGDSPRRIHWAKYAQTGKLYSKHFIDHEQHERWLDWSQLRSGSVEQRLSHLCARVLELSEQQQRYGLRLPGNILSPDTGKAHRSACLTALALYPDSA